MRIQELVWPLGLVALSSKRHGMGVLMVYATNV